MQVAWWVIGTICVQQECSVDLRFYNEQVPLWKSNYKGCVWFLVVVFFAKFHI